MNANERKPARRIFSTRELNLTDDTPAASGACQPPAGAATTLSGLLVPCKTITVYPIWAWAMIFGPKRVENRSWATAYRGRLAIHAGQNRTTEDEDRAWIEARGLHLPASFAAGVILGTVDVIDCQPYAGPLRGDPWACGEFCWILANPRPLVEPIPARGKLSLWTCQVPPNA